MGNDVFVVVYDGDIYKVTKCGKEFHTENGMTGELSILLSKNFNDGSGNEHLIGTLEHAINREYSKLLINSTFGEGTV